MTKRIRKLIWTSLYHSGFRTTNALNLIFRYTFYLHFHVEQKIMLEKEPRIVGIVNKNI